MNWADATILGILIISGLISLRRGLVKEALSLANWALALLIAMTFRDRLAEFLVDSIHSPSLRYISAFAILFIFSFTAGVLVNHLAGEAIKRSGLSSVDRLLGTLFGLARGLIIVMAIIVVMPSVLPVDREDWWDDSVLIPRLEKFDGEARRIARDFWDLSEDVLDEPF